MNDTFRPEDHSDQHEHEMRYYGSCTVCTERKAESMPVIRSDRFTATKADLQAEVQAMAASVLFLDAAERGLVTEPEDAPHSETEMVFECPNCHGYGEVPVHQYEDGQWEAARCTECDGTGAVTY